MDGTGHTGAVDRPDWHAAFDELTALAELDAHQLERLAVAAHLIGRDRESDSAWERAQRLYAERGDPANAARCAFWLGLQMLLRGQGAQAGGWVARAARTAGEAGPGCAVQGFVLIPEFLQLLWSGRTSEANELSVRMSAIAEQCRDPELTAFGLLCRGEVQLARGETDLGMRSLDEAMVAVTAGEISPIPAGILYCAVIEACVDALDLRRAGEWTEALHRWCREQSGAVPYRGSCLVHRAQVLQASGAWDAAMSEAEAAMELLGNVGHPALGNACYQIAELHRLRGEFDEAMRAYREANDHGRDPTPGMLLLRVAEGRAGSAVAAVERMVEQSRGLRTRPTVLAAAVEVMLAAGQLDAARAAADELERIVDETAPPYLIATADYAVGCVRLADGDAATALSHLRRASSAWLAIDVPYEAAKARVESARALRALGDDDTADLELAAARAAFERLGARPELERLAALEPSGTSHAEPVDGVLTDREREVLALVATGATNRQIAADLHISAHTVARHLQNVFTKLGISSRAAATSYAHRHGLV